MIGSEQSLAARSLAANRKALSRDQDVSPNFARSLCLCASDGPRPCPATGASKWGCKIRSARPHGLLAGGKVARDFLASRQPDVAEAACPGDEVTKDPEPHRPAGDLGMQHHGHEPLPFPHLVQFPVPDR